MADTLEISIDANGIARIALARPEAGNAINDVMLAELTAALAGLGQNEGLRVLILTAQGERFCSGMDMTWLKRADVLDAPGNFDEALRLARLLQLLDRIPTPTIACVHGNAEGVGVGLVACCDMVVADRTTSFCLPETRMGVAPAIIAPYVVSRLGVGMARRYMLTGEAIKAERAAQAGLVHEVVDTPIQMRECVKDWVEALLKAAPHAVATAKRMITNVAYRPVDDALISDSAHRIAHLHTHPEAREGMAATLEQRPPHWFRSSDS